METWEKELVDMMKNSSETPDAWIGSALPWVSCTASATLRPSPSRPTS